MKVTLKTLPNQMGAQIAVLTFLSHAELKRHYRELIGSSPPKRARSKLLILAIAYELQCRAYSVKRTAIEKKLKIDQFKNNGGSVAITTAPANTPRKTLKPGGRLIREWHGVSHEVYVAKDGVYMDGKRFQSLSSVATHITGVQTNGPKFFGLRSTQVNS